MEQISFEQYQERAYVAIQKHSGQKEEVMHWAIGLGEEAGEVLSVIKHKYYGGQYEIEEFIEEIGDLLWHAAALCTAMNISLNDAALYNLAKLQHRYPEGSFDEQRSQQRHALIETFKVQSTDRERIVSEIKNTTKEKEQ